MAIAVECECGRQYRLKDAAAGKRFKCSACGSVVAVPAAEARPEGGEPEPPAGQVCRNCGAGNPPDARRCHECTRILKRKGRRGVDRPVVTYSEPKRFAVDLPFKKIGVLLSVVAAVAATWFFAIEPLGYRRARDVAFSLVLRGDTQRGVERLTQVKDEEGERRRREVDRLISRAHALDSFAEFIKMSAEARKVPLEAVHSFNTNLQMEQESFSKRARALVFEAHVKNSGNAPVTLDPANFYLAHVVLERLPTDQSERRRLRRMGRKPPVRYMLKSRRTRPAIAHQSSTLEGNVLEPGEEWRGNIVFLNLHGEGIESLSGLSLASSSWVLYLDGERQGVFHVNGG